MIAPNRCPPGWAERSCEQRHSPRSAGTCSPFQGVNINGSSVDPGLRARHGRRGAVVTAPWSLADCANNVSGLGAARASPETSRFICRILARELISIGAKQRYLLPLAAT